MHITQDTIINQIATNENMDAATVRQIFKATENIIFHYLSSVTPTETITIKLLNGIHIKRKYVDRKRYTKGMFQNVDCPEHVSTKACITKYYNAQVNQMLKVKLYKEMLQ